MTPPRCLLTLAVLLGTLAQPLHADIYSWDNGQLIPGTEGITPGPGVQLDHMDLEYARLWGEDLTAARLEASNLAMPVLWLDRGAYRGSDLTQANLTGANLTNADLSSSTLTEANLTGANLTEANLTEADLTEANLTDSVVAGADFSRGWDGTVTGISHAQLASTASYQAKDLQGIGLGERPERLGLQRAESHQRGSGFLDVHQCQPDRGQPHRRVFIFLDPDQSQPDRGRGDGGVLRGYNWLYPGAAGVDR